MNGSQRKSNRKCLIYRWNELINTSIAFHYNIVQIYRRGCDSCIAQSMVQDICMGRHLKNSPDVKCFSICSHWISWTMKRRTLCLHCRLPEALATTRIPYKWKSIIWIGCIWWIRAEWRIWKTFFDKICGQKVRMICTFRWWSRRSKWADECRWDHNNVKGEQNELFYSYKELSFLWMTATLECCHKFSQSISVRGGLCSDRKLGIFGSVYCTVLMTFFCCCCSFQRHCPFVIAQCILGAAEWIARGS